MEGLTGFKIEKLCENIFHIWQKNIKMLLSLKELGSHVDVEKSSQKDRQLDSWAMNDARAMALIGLNLSDDYLE